MKSIFEVLFYLKFSIASETCENDFLLEEQYEYEYRQQAGQLHIISVSAKLII